jgi:amino acid transporter
MSMFQSIVKVRGCSWWGAEFISLRIPTSGGLYAYVINTVSQN